MAQYLFCIDIPVSGVDAFHCGNYSPEEAERLLAVIREKHPEPEPYLIDLTNSGNSGRPQVDIDGALAEWDVTERGLKHLEGNPNQLANALTCKPDTELKRALCGNAYWLYLRWHWARSVAARIVSMRTAHAPQDADEKTGGKGHKKAGVNARMLEAMYSNNEAAGWSCVQWAAHLKCGKSTVVEQPAWKDLKIGRQRVKEEKALDRRRRARGSDRRD